MLVVGAGAAGLESARVLALQGHTVEIHERTDALGGVLDAVSAADPVLARYRDWLRHEVELAGVRIVTGRAVTVETVRDTGVDTVVVATGPVWARPEVAGAGRVRIPPDLGDLLTEGSTLPDTIAILGGGKPGLTLALALRARGSEVTLVEPTTVFGTELGLPGRWRMVADAQAAGVTLCAGAVVSGLAPTAVELRRNGGTESVPARLVVTTHRVAGSPALADTLRGTGIPTFVVGDALGGARVRGHHPRRRGHRPRPRRLNGATDRSRGVGRWWAVVIAAVTRYGSGGVV